MQARRIIVYCMLSTIAGWLMCYLAIRDRQRCGGSVGLFEQLSEVSLRYYENVGPYDVFREDCFLNGRSERRLVFVNCQNDLVIEIPEDPSSNTISVGKGALREWYRQWPADNKGVRTRAVAVKRDGSAGETIWDLDGDGRFDKLAGIDGTIHLLNVESGWNEAPAASQP